MKLYGFQKDEYLFFQYDFPRDRETSGFVDIPHNLYGLSNLGEKLEKWRAFPISYFVIWMKSGGGAIVPMIDLIVARAGEEFMVINHISEYQMTVFDLKKKDISFEFTRKYRRVKTPSDYVGRKGPIIEGKPVDPPRPKFLNDIDNVFIHEDKILVLTSTVDKDKGTLVDVFDFEGTYVDNFYLDIPKNLSPQRYKFQPMTFSGGFFYFIETAADDTYVISKYKIMDR